MQHPWKSVEPLILKQFLKHLSWLMILNLAVKPAYLLIIDTKIQDLLGPEEFGRYFPLLSLSILLNILLDAGLANHMTRLISGNPNEIHQAFQRGWRTKSVLFPAYFVLLMSIGWLLGWRGESLIWLAWIGINQALLSAILYIRAGLQGIGAHRPDAWVSVGDRSMLFLSMGALIFSFERFELTWLLMGTSVALFLTCIIALWRLKKQALFVDRLPSPLGDGSARNIQEDLKSGWPYALLFLLMMTYHRVDGIMLERLAPDGAIQAGWYAMSYRFFEAANMIGFLCATLLLPYFTRMLAQRADVRPLARSMSSVLLAVGASIAWASWFFPEAFLGAFYDYEIQAAAGILPWLMISFAVFAQGYVFSTLLTARGDLRVLNRMAAAGALLNITLNAWWLSQASATNGGMGCAIISAITQGAMVGGQIYFSLRNHPGRQWWKLLRALLLHSLACFAICSLLARWGINPKQALWIALIGCLAAGLLPGVIDFRSMKKMLSEKMNTFADS